MSVNYSQLPLPAHYDPARVGALWRVPYEQRAAEAEAWAARFGLTPAREDRRRVALLAVDVQNTFCLPDFELYVGGRSGAGAVDDTRRLCEFIYRNLGVITDIIPFEPDESRWEPSEAPPTPERWMTAQEPLPDTLLGAGLGLFGVREVPLVGRQVARDQMWDARRRVRHEARPHVLVLEGPSGFGKTGFGNTAFRNSGFRNSGFSDSKLGGFEDSRIGGG